MAERYQEDTHMTAPTPNSMPGAQGQPQQQPEASPQLQQPVSTSTPPAQQQAPAPAPAPQPPAQAAPPAQQAPAAPPATDDGKQPMTLEAWRELARKNEQRAKDNEEAAKKWEAEQAAKRTKEENDRIAIQQAEERARKAEENLARERVARTTGVEPEFLGGGTEEEMRATAQRLLEWRGTQANPQQPPPPQTSAVSASSVTPGAVPIGTAPNGVQQLTIDQFRALNPAERMEAVRNGQCTNLGVGKPKEQRRMGNEIEVSAHGARR